MNIQINQFYNDMMNIITKSELPAGVIYFVVKDLLFNIEAAYQQDIIIQQYQTQNDNEEKEENSSIGQE